MKLSEEVLMDSVEVDCVDNIWKISEEIFKKNIKTIFKKNKTIFIF